MDSITISSLSFAVWVQDCRRKFREIQSRKFQAENSKAGNSKAENSNIMDGRCRVELNLPISHIRADSIMAIICIRLYILARHSPRHSHYYELEYPGSLTYEELKFVRLRTGRNTHEVLVSV